MAGKDCQLAGLHAQVEPFLRALFVEHTGFIEARVIGPNGAQSRFFPSVDALLDALPELAYANSQQRNIYTGVNPRVRERGRQENVQYVVAFHADVDAQDGLLLDASELTKRAVIAPSIIVGSGHGLHFYWLLRQPLDVSDSDLLSQARGINAALAVQLGADHCHDLGRVLRMPGFTNWKEPSKPKTVELLSCDAERRYSLQDFATLRPAPLPVNTPAPAETGNEPPQLSARVQALVETDTQVKLRWHGDPLGLNDPTRSAIDLSLVSLLAHRDCSDLEIIDALLVAPYNRDRQAELTPDYLARTIRKARSGPASPDVRTASEASKSSALKGKKSQATILVDLTENVLANGQLELWHTPGGQPYATLTMAEHRENWGLRSSAFRSWSYRQYFVAMGSTPSSQAVQSALGVLMGRALFDGEEHEAFVRVAEHADFTYIDLGDPGWRAIEIGPSGWAVINNPPVRFRRARGMLPLPEPTRGGCVNDVFQFLNIDDCDYQILFLSCLVTALNPRGPYPILALHGVQGCGKSTAATLFRKLTDPNEAPLRTPPRDERDLIIAATNAYVVALDNLSSIPPWLSDALCRLSTGGGFSTRELFTDTEETIFAARRPVLLNGLEELAAQGDLLDRMVILRLAPIMETARRDEKAFWREFEAAYPQFFGAVLDAVHAASINSGKVRLPALPRMADFAILATAAEGVFGVAPGAFMDAYQRNRAETNQIALESSQVALALLALLDRQGVTFWEGTASQLLDELTPLVAESVQRSKFWPRTGQGMGRALDRIAANLGAAGVSVSRLPRGRERVIRIEKRGKQRSEMSETSPEAQKDDIYDVSDISAPLLSVHEDTASESNPPQAAAGWYRPEPLPGGGWRCECGWVGDDPLEWSRHTGIGGCPLKRRS